MSLEDNRFIRSALWISAVFNLGGACLFAFPASPLGQFAGLPLEVPALYRAFVALFVLLFAGLYAWLAMQPTPHRPMVAFSAIGKSSAFVLILVFWLAGAAPLRGVQAAVGDLLLAGAYLYWLRRTA